MIQLHVYFEMTAKTFEGFVVTEAKQHQSHLGTRVGQSCIFLQHCVFTEFNADKWSLSSEEFYSTVNWCLLSLKAWVRKNMSVFPSESLPLLKIATSLLCLSNNWTIDHFYLTLSDRLVFLSLSVLVMYSIYWQASNWQWYALSWVLSGGTDSKEPSLICCLKGWFGVKST